MTIKKFILPIVTVLATVLLITGMVALQRGNFFSRTDIETTNAQTIASSVLKLADTLSSYQAQSLDAAHAQIAILEKTTAINTALTNIGTSTLSTKEVQTIETTYSALSTMLTHYQTDLVALDTAQNNQAATTKAVYATTQRLYKYVVGSDKNANVEPYTITAETNAFMSQAGN